MTAKKISILVVTLLSVTTQLTYAYVPPSFYIVRSMAKRHGPIQQVQIKHRLSTLKSNGEVNRTYTEVLHIDEGELATVKIIDENGKEIASKTRRINTGTVINRPVMYDLLFAKDSSAMFEHFKSLGLPLKTEAELYAEKDETVPYKPESYVSLTRHESRVYITVGDNSRGVDSLKKSTSLWVEKENLLPVRANFPTPPQSGTMSEPLEFFISNYQPHGSFLYPKSVTVYKDERPWFKLDVAEVKLNASEIQQVTQKAEADAEAKEFLENYFKWAR